MGNFKKTRFLGKRFSKKKRERKDLTLNSPSKYLRTYAIYKQQGRAPSPKQVMTFEEKEEKSEKLEIILKI